MTVIIKASGEADLLSLFPAVLGFAPNDSVVILAFRGKRTCGTLRVDLPGNEQSAAFSRVALGAIGTICKIPGADGVAFAVFTPESFGDSTSIPHEDFADVLLDRIADSGLNIKDALCRAADGWASYLDGSVPAGGHPLTLLDDTTRIDLPESHVDSDGRDLPDRVPAAGPGQRRQMLERLEAIEAAIDRITTVYLAHPGIAEHQIDAMLAKDIEFVEATLDFPSFANGALDWTPSMLDDHAAMLLYGITLPAVRDDTMVLWAFGLDDRSPDRTPPNTRHGGKNRSQRRRGGAGRSGRKAVTIDIGDRLTGFGPRPDPDRMLRAIDILLYLIARADDRDRLAPLCMVAWLSWGLGRASHAGRYLRQVHAIDPAYGMGQVLAGVFTTYPLPEWAFAVP